MTDDMDYTETKFDIGEDLYGVSVAELKTRITRLNSEVARIEAELEKKKRELSAADLLFSPKK